MPICIEFQFKIFFVTAFFCFTFFVTAFFVTAFFVTAFFFFAFFVTAFFFFFTFFCFTKLLIYIIGHFNALRKSSKRWTS